jgi:hypothetical protein
VNLELGILREQSPDAPEVALPRSGYFDGFLIGTREEVARAADWLAGGPGRAAEPPSNDVPPAR